MGALPEAVTALDRIQGREVPAGNHLPCSMTQAQLRASEPQLLLHTSFFFPLLYFHVSDLNLSTRPNTHSPGQRAVQSGTALWFGPEAQLTCTHFTLSHAQQSGHCMHFPAACPSPSCTASPQLHADIPALLQTQPQSATVELGRC